MNTRTIARLGACAGLGALLAAAAIHAPAAHADSGDFLNRIQDLGWYNNSGDAYLLDNGWAVCRALNQGYNGRQVAEFIYANTGASVDADDAVEFVVIAVEELCPQYDNRGSAA